MAVRLLKEKAISIEHSPWPDQVFCLLQFSYSLIFPHVSTSYLGLSIDKCKVDNPILSMVIHGRWQPVERTPMGKMCIFLPQVAKDLASDEDLSKFID